MRTEHIFFIPCYLWVFFSRVVSFSAPFVMCIDVIIHSRWIYLLAAFLEVTVRLHPCANMSSLFLVFCCNVSLCVRVPLTRAVALPLLKGPKNQCSKCPLVRVSKESSSGTPFHVSLSDARERERDHTVRSSYYIQTHPPCSLPKSLPSRLSRLMETLICPQCPAAVEGVWQD